jgi:hypothetical protein
MSRISELIPKHPALPTLLEAILPPYIPLTPLNSFIIELTEIE